VTEGRHRLDQPGSPIGLLEVDSERDRDPVARRAGIVLNRPPFPGLGPLRRWWALLSLTGVGVLLAGVAVVVLHRPGASLGPTQAPHEGQTAIGLTGSRLETYGDQRAAPIGSVAKVMTAYLILRHHPLHKDSDGPALHIHADDVRDYKSRISSGQSLLEVRDGDELSERQALAALLIPSANNIADLLADWDADSVDDFVSEMNATAAEFGLRHTHYVDPSGFEPATVSTAIDQSRLAEHAMRIPVFAELVALRSVDLPRAGTVRNYNAMLGHDGVIGVKTGTTDQAGGNVVFAAQVEVHGTRRLVVGAVLGQKIGASTDDSLAQAFGVERYLLGQVTA
jgi:D-alanyl-D-alanine carboxypeptidase (penicillin-binding protein 5/6)